jgi:subtilisin family serine protease
MQKISLLFLFIFLLFDHASAQDEKERTWHLQKPGGTYAGAAVDSVQCIPSHKIIVAVLDGGTDITHPDLADHIWINEDEIPGNSIDDDNNGYVDDVHGWNFLGGKTGNVDHETEELTRLYRTPKSQLPAGIKYKSIKKEYRKELKHAKHNAAFFLGIRDSFNLMLQRLGTDAPTAEQLQAYPMSGKLNNSVKKSIVFALQNGITYNRIMDVINEAAQEAENDLKYHLNVDYNPRSIIGDDITNVNERNYGNSDVKGGAPLHGTHVAGIIGAVRHNGIGGDGITDNVQLMIVRIVPDGDERDKDVANGIRYAVDNGAKIINMSFGKAYSPDRAAVEQAILYAASKDVLLVEGCGNDGQDNDTHPDFPTAYMLSTKSRIANWISVGSSNMDGTASDFSNYGSQSVDIFAPGVNIYSTLPDAKYGVESGTSMASPVVAGVAGLVWSCFPQLSAVQVKEAIMKSVIKNDALTPLPGNKKKVVPFSSLSVSGGIVNAERALKEAAALVH